MYKIPMTMLEQTERINRLETALHRIANYDYRKEDLSMPEIAMEALDEISTANN